MADQNPVCCRPATYGITGIPRFRQFPGFFLEFRPRRVKLRHGTWIVPLIRAEESFYVGRNETTRLLEHEDQNRRPHAGDFYRDVLIPNT